MREATNTGQMSALVLDSTMLPHVITEVGSIGCI